MEIKICIPLLLLLVSLARCQSPHHRSYDWRTTGGALGDWPKLTSLLPYAPAAAPTASSSVHHPAQSYHHPSYPEDSPPPYADDYSQEYHLEPYGEVPQSLSSYESYQDPRDEELNMTMARVGGFAGSGDTKGFGAYDFPKDNRLRHQDFRHPDPPLHLHQRPPQMDPELEELMRISKQRSDSYRDPHPLPPPL